MFAQNVNEWHKKMLDEKTICLNVKNKTSNITCITEINDKQKVHLGTRHQNLTA